MKLRIFLALISMILLNTGSYANYQFNLNGSCDDFKGEWSGKGRATNWLLGSCTYHGTGIVRELDSQGQFIIQVSADKESGPFLCPSHAAQELKADCSDSLVTVHTEYGSLSGNFTATSGSAQGTLTVSPGLEADVSIQFFR